MADFGLVSFHATIVATGPLHQMTPTRLKNPGFTRHLCSAMSLLNITKRTLEHQGEAKTEVMGQVRFTSRQRLFETDNSQCTWDRVRGRSIHRI